MRQADVEPYGPAPGLRRASIRRFHDAAPPAGANDVSVAAGREALRPHSDRVRQFPSLLVVTGHGPVGANARGAHKDDGFVNVLMPKCSQGVQILGQDTQRTRVVALQELRILVGDT